MKNCDIIIPIYNAYECVEKCIQTVVKYTDLKEHRLLLINDASTDELIKPFLEKCSKTNPNVIHLENCKNLGFVGTVNRGMKESTNDVLLLNSDTEVTSGWLDKIRLCAYSQKKVATVTPLSNNATSVSVPIGLQENDLPNNMTLEEYSSLVEQDAYNDVNEIPSGHGFCMYIRREALDIIGYFDEKTFGLGYGEENDFCFRALDYGFTNLLCDNTIIYHKEKQSFTELREELAKKHAKILEQRYPIYYARNEMWLQQFPILYICKNIKYRINLYKRKNILMTIHNWKDTTGGTTLHVLDLICNLRKEINIHILTPEDGSYKLYSYFEDQEEILSLYGVESYAVIPRFNHRYKELVTLLIDALNIEGIHVQHMIGHYYDIADIIKEKQIPSLITLHDFYSITPAINSTKKAEIDFKQELSQIKNTTGLSNNIIKNWEQDWFEYLSAFDSVIVPSNTIKEENEKIYKNVKFDLIEHGSDINKEDYKININKIKTYNVAFVGVMAEIKGGNILSELIKKRSNINIKFHLFGKSEISNLVRNKANYEYHGPYKREELPKLLKENNIHLVCQLSIVPESFSYVLTEVIATGIPVLGFNIGAVGERIAKHKFGYLMPISTSVLDIIKEIEKIFTDKEKYYNVLENVYNYKIKSSHEMSLEYKKYYDKWKNKNIKSYKPLNELMIKAFKLKTTSNMSEISWITNSLKWQIISKIKVPHFVRKIGRKLLRR